MGSLPPRHTAGFVTTCFDNWLEGIPLVLEKLLMRREAVVSRQASGGPRCFKLLYEIGLGKPCINAIYFGSSAVIPE